jgi:IS30 family transposase
MQRALRKQLLKQAAQVRQLRDVSRRKTYRPSKLDAHRASIEVMHQAGHSTRTIAWWLRLHEQQAVHHSTVARALQRWAKDD